MRAIPCWEAGPIIGYDNLKSVAHLENPEVDGSGAHLLSDGMFDGIFYEGLNGKGRNKRLGKGFWHLPVQDEASPIALFFYFKVVLYQGQLFGEGDKEVFSQVQAAAQKLS
jgi:hypothetical protein